MARLSLYKLEKGRDFKFLDRTINETFQIGGTDCLIHKYLGPVNPEDGESSPGLPINDNPIPELGIQDWIFSENRDRRYEQDVYTIRGIYTRQDVDLDLSQFGLFLSNDTILLHFHLRSSVEALGRKLMSGDVIELPHMKDEYALNDAMVALRKFYVVQDVTRPAIGYSPTWYPHLIRAKCIPLVDSQEFSDILDRDSGDGENTIRDLISTYNKSIEYNKAIIEQATLDSPKSGYETRQFYVIPTDNLGLVELAPDASNTVKTVDIESAALDASIILKTPTRDVYVGYLTGDGIPPNGMAFSQGTSFPEIPQEGQFHLRTDYMPNRLFRFSGKIWLKFEDNVRMTLNPLGQEQTATTGNFPGKDVLLTQKGSFINNVTTATIAGQVVQERQSLSKALKPKADNI